MTKVISQCTDEWGGCKKHISAKCGEPDGSIETPQAKK
jgi:hypothetical protein